jgi:hypothetical protein
MSASGGAINPTSSNRIDNIKVWGRNTSGTINPTVTSATLTSLTNATVVFSIPVNAATAQNIANYTGLGVTSAVLSTTKDTVNLAFPSLTNGDSYTLTIAHVHDTSSVLGDTMFVPQSFPFFYNASIDTLVITEINYKTPLTTSSTSDSLQYIELYNNNSAQTRVGGYKLTTSGFGTTTLYTFPAGTIIAPNAYVVFAYDTAAVNKFYHITNTLYWTGSHISTTSAKLSIINTVGGYIDSITYKHTATSGFDTMANGHGPSLVLCTPGTTIAYNCNPANWTAATDAVGLVDTIEVYGNPGTGCGPVGIRNFSASNSGLNCYPNPTRNNLTVAPNGFATDIKMFDILGNVVYETKNISSPININTSSLTSGMYFIRVTYSDNKVSSRKISVD